MNRVATTPRILGFLMLISGIEAYFLTPHAQEGADHPALEQVIPASFGDWHAIVMCPRDVAIGIELDVEAL